MRHLDHDLVRALLAGDPAVRAELAEHLATSCEACEAFLAEHAGAPELDAAADRLLLHDLPGSLPLDEVAYARLRKRMTRPLPLSRIGTAVGALAALVMVAVLTPKLLAHRSGEEGLKGRAPLGLELSAAVKTERGVARADMGSTVPVGGVLLLRYHASDGAKGVLVRKVAGGSPEVLGEVELQPGTHDLSAREGLLGVPLTSQGNLELWLVAASGGDAPTPAQALAAVSGQRSGSVTVSEVHFDVASGRPSPSP